jgi:hypothetical protein
MESQMDWKETTNGNWVLIDTGDLIATVHSTENGWGAIWNGAADGRGRRLKVKFQSAEEAMRIVESAIAEGERYAVNMHGLRLGQANRTTWFPTAEQAREAVAAFLGGDYKWCWTTNKPRNSSRSSGQVKTI